MAKYQANLEADQYGCMDVARQIWAAILQAQPFTASLWMDFIQLEKTYGDKKVNRIEIQQVDKNQNKLTGEVENLSLIHI